jgi:hypothetical protein
MLRKPSKETRIDFYNNWRLFTFFAYILFLCSFFFNCFEMQWCKHFHGYVYTLLASLECEQAVLFLLNLIRYGTSTMFISREGFWCMHNYWNFIIHGFSPFLIGGQTRLMNFLKFMPIRACNLTATPKVFSHTNDEVELRRLVTDETSLVIVTCT